MRKNAGLFFLILTSILLTACNFPRQQAATADPKLIATQVELMLTKAPPTILPLTPSPTTAPPPMGTLPPTQQVPSETSSPPTPVPSVIAPNEDPKLSLGDPTWQDTLDVAKNFYLYEDSHVKFESRPGYLALIALHPDNWYAWTLSITKIANFYMEAVFKTGSCSGSDRYGLIVRADSQNEGYLYGFTCDGQFNLRKWDSEKFSDLIKRTQSPAIQKGANQSNRMGLMANGGHFSLFANGNLLAQADDFSYASGAFGFLISSANTENLTVQADEIAYWKLP